MAVDRTPPATSKKKDVQPKSSTVSASQGKPSAPPPLNIKDLASIPNSHPSSPTESEKSPRTSGRNRTPSIKQKEATNDDVTTNKQLALVTPKKRKNPKDNDDDNSPSKKAKSSRKQGKQSTLESDAETDWNDHDDIAQFIVKTITGAMHTQEQRLTLLTEQLQKH